MGCDMSKAEQKKLTQQEYTDWLTMCLRGQSKVTLTFDTTWWKSNRRQPAVGHWEGKPYEAGSEWVVGDWVAYGMFRRWVMFLNRLVAGDHYRAHWKHSYFGYLLTKEYQSRGTVHFHLIIDNWYPWKQASSWWWEKCGSIKQERIGDLRHEFDYALKYCLKSGFQPDIWVPNKRWMGGRAKIVDINLRYQELMSQPFDVPKETAYSMIADKGLSEGRGMSSGDEVDFQPDLDSPVLQHKA